METLTRVFNDTDIRTFDIDGQLYAVAADVAEALEYGLATDFTRLVKEKYKGMRNVHTPGGPQEMTCVSEPGLMQALATMRKPIAEDFQDWLYEDVLESIYETGWYRAERSP